LCEFFYPVFSSEKDLKLIPYTRSFVCSLVDAGGDLSSIVIRSLILMLVAFPEVQAKMHQEIDSVIGERLPAIDDIKNLPYLQAVIAEVKLV
jgi:cytochrome P450